MCYIKLNLYVEMTFFFSYFPVDCGDVSVFVLFFFYSVLTDKLVPHNRLSRIFIVSIEKERYPKQQKAKYLKAKLCEYLCNMCVCHMYASVNLAGVSCACCETFWSKTIWVSRRKKSTKTHTHTHLNSTCHWLMPVEKYSYSKR